jgi:Fe-S cluster assembly protein SufD
MADTSLDNHDTALTEAGTSRDLPLTNGQVEMIGRKLGEPGWLVDRRREALQKCQTIQPPSSSDIEWRRTDLATLSLGDLKLAALPAEKKLARIPAAVTRLIAGRDTGGQIVFSGGDGTNGWLDERIKQSGVVFSSFPRSARETPDPMRKWMGRIVTIGDGKFTALTSAIYDVGLCVYVPDGVQVEKPLHSLFWMPGCGMRAYRMLIIVGDGASLKLFHENVSPEERDIATRIGMMEILVGRNGKLDLIDQQSWGSNIRHIAHQKAVVQKDGLLQWTSAFWGSRSSKTFLDIDLAEEGASGRWSGLAFLDLNQRADCSTRQNHLAPRTKSDLSYRAVLAGTSRSAWSGMIYVAPDSKQADGYQVNRNLILSDRAHTDSIPGLEILTDDVRCSHGVAIGELNPEEIFYLMSRGISGMDVERLLVEGFFESVIEAISIRGAKDRIRQAVGKKTARFGEEGILINGVRI